MLIDLREALRRLSYWRLAGALRAGEIPSRPLLFPITLPADKGEIRVAETAGRLLRRLGFELRCVGPALLSVRQIPRPLDTAEVVPLVRDVLGQLATGHDPTVGVAQIDELLQAMAVHGISRANQARSLTEMNALLRELEAARLLSQCNSTKKLWVQISMDELNRLFCMQNRLADEALGKPVRPVTRGVELRHPSPRSAPPLIFLMGPTAVGKTALAVELAQRLPLGIISVDSAMVYRGMDIGTGKPGPELLARAVHRLIDIRDPTQTYSAAEFARDGRTEVAAVQAQDRIPLLVGGSGLYFRAFYAGLSALPSANREVRERLSREAAKQGWPALHARLATIDPQTAGRIQPQDGQRIQRAIEIYELTGRTMSQWLGQQRRTAWPGATVKIILEPGDRAVLHRRISERFRDMLVRGFVEEVARLQATVGVHADLPALRAVGYRQVGDYLVGRMDYAAMVTQGIVATRQLAKRQLTWLRSERDAVRFEAFELRLLDRVLGHLSAVLLGQR